MDSWFPAIERLEGLVDALEDQALGGDVPDLPHRIHELKREIADLRRRLRPAEDAVTALLREGGAVIEPRTHPFLRDLRDHAQHAIAILDGLTDRLRSVLDLHLAMNGQRLNEVMKMLTLVSTVFIPMTFHRRRLRHELPEHARAGRPLGLPDRARRDAARRWRNGRLVPPQALALTRLRPDCHRTA